MIFNKIKSGGIYIIATPPYFADIPIFSKAELGFV